MAGAYCRKMDPRLKGEDDVEWAQDLSTPGSPSLVSVAQISPAYLRPI
jgi:hypothetical protein